MRYAWTVRNVAHIPRHALVPAQVETAIGDRYRTVAVVQVGGEERGVLHGACAIGGRLRVLRVVFVIRGGAVRVITAMRGRGRQTRPYLTRRAAMEAQEAQEDGDDGDD